MKIVVGISGASGVIYGIKLLERLRELQIETHLVLSNWAKKTIEIETSYKVEEVIAMANYCHSNTNLGAPIASGSFQTTGMVIIPCSMKTLSAIAHGYSESLLVRAADVAIKENKKLLLVTRETPLNAVHLENMLKLARIGVTIMPPVPAFYNHPSCLDDIIDHLLSRIMDQFGINNNLTKRWEGYKDGLGEL